MCMKYLYILYIFSIVSKINPIYAWILFKSQELQYQKWVVWYKGKKNTFLTLSNSNSAWLFRSNITVTIVFGGAMIVGPHVKVHRYY